MAPGLPVCAGQPKTSPSLFRAERSRFRLAPVFKVPFCFGLKHTCNCLHLSLSPPSPFAALQRGTRARGR